LGSVLLVLLAIAWGVLLIPKLLQRGDGGFGIPNPFAFLGAIFGAMNGGASRVFGRNDPLSKANRSTVGRYGAVGHMHQVARIPTAAAARSRRSAKRRRDVLFGLIASAFGTAVMSLIPGFSMLWKAHLIVDVLLLGYVFLLVAVRNSKAGAQAPSRAYSYEQSPAIDGAPQFSVPRVHARRSSAQFFDAEGDLPFAYARASNE
jgi:hypothetical protein